MIGQQEESERIVARAALDRANNEDRRNGSGTLNSTAEYWHNVASLLSEHNRALLEQIEALQARIAELEAAQR